MKQFLFFVILLLAIVFGISQVVRHKIGNDLAQPVADTVLSPSPTLTIDKNQVSRTSLFVPYWTLTNTGEIDKNYDQYIYFGVAPDTNGIKADNGKAQIKTFITQAPADKKKFLALQMIDSTMNSRVLRDQSLQKKIISQTTDLASQNGFSGVVLDLEMSAIPFNSLIDQISSFNSDFYKAVRAKNMQYVVTLYGDTFYRVRPFDVKKLSSDADMVMIMAYDFHKSRANPGPNFPLHGSDTYGYDMSKMGDDFLRSVSSMKVNVVFGMFGYDWAVDNAGKAIDQGKPLTYLEIKKKFLDKCTYAHCEWHRDTISGETEIQYTDTDAQKHIVWFEDTQSVKAKQDYLKTIGIVKYAYWAYSYF